MKTAIALAAIAAAALATPALAQDGKTYVQVNLGGNVAGTVDGELTIAPDTFSGEADLETGLFASVALGGTTASGISAEIEVLQLTTDIDTADIEAALGGPFDASLETLGTVINVAYNFDTGNQFTPYVGAGVGYGETQWELDGGEAEEKGIIWQLKAGATYALSDTVTLDAGYRYITLPKTSYSEPGVSLEIETAAHVLTIGARYSF